MVDSCSALQTFLNPSVKTMNFSQMSRPQKNKTKYEGGPRDRGLGVGWGGRVEGCSTENTQQQLHGALGERTCQHNPPFTINVSLGL